MKEFLPLSEQKTILGLVEDHSAGKAMLKKVNNPDKNDLLKGGKSVYEDNNDWVRKSCEKHSVSQK